MCMSVYVNVCVHPSAPTDRPSIHAPAAAASSAARGACTAPAPPPAAPAAGAAGAARLKAYWLTGEGLTKWASKPHPWTALRDHLAKHLPLTMATQVATAWYHEHFGYYPGSDAARVARGQKPKGKTIGPG